MTEQYPSRSGTSGRRRRCRLAAAWRRAARPPGSWPPPAPPDGPTKYDLGCRPGATCVAVTQRSLQQAAANPVLALAGQGKRLHHSAAAWGSHLGAGAIQQGAVRQEAVVAVVGHQVARVAHPPLHDAPLQGAPQMSDRWFDLAGSRCHDCFCGFPQQDCVFFHINRQC